MILDLNTVRFGAGNHAPDDTPTGDRDLCIMEAVAYMAGEPWSDSPKCASKVISAFLRVWNDDLSDEDRDRLLPAAVWVPKLVGSRGDDATEERRAYMALDWLVRAHLPAWLDLTPILREHAAALRALPEILDADIARTAARVVDAAGAVAGAAARATAWTAAWDAAWDAARAAAWTAARSAAWSAVGAAGHPAAAAEVAADAAAWATAWAVAWSVAESAGSDALRPTTEALQQSALELLNRMLECSEHCREEKR
jgi:hypothetical protein